mgnify:CR=1 FL=1
MERIKIGQIVNAVALRGEVKIYNYSDLFSQISFNFILELKNFRCYNMIC